MKTAVIVSGGFDPLTPGHCAYFEEAAQLGEVYCLVNNDDWLRRKKGKPFMPLQDRCTIISQNIFIEEVCIQQYDTDDVSLDIESIHKELKDKYDKIIFFKSGDRNTREVIPESSMCDLLGIDVVIGMGRKIAASSQYLKDWIGHKNTYEKVFREWGYYETYEDFGTHKVKKLVVEPGKSLSLQRHFKRSEWWFVVSGTGSVLHDGTPFPLEPMDCPYIEMGDWHKLSNTGTVDLVVIEVQIGSECVEEDIQRA